MTKAARKVTRSVQANPLPEPRPVNRGGMELPPALMRKVRRAIDQVDRGEYHTFKTVDEEMRYIFGPKA